MFTVPLVFTEHAHIMLVYMVCCHCRKVFLYAVIYCIFKFMLLSWAHQQVQNIITWCVTLQTMHNPKISHLSILLTQSKARAKVDSFNTLAKRYSQALRVYDIMETPLYSICTYKWKFDENYICLKNTQKNAYAKELCQTCNEIFL